MHKSILSDKDNMSGSRSKYQQKTTFLLVNMLMYNSCYENIIVNIIIINIYIALYHTLLKAPLHKTTEILLTIVYLSYNEDISFKISNLIVHFLLKDSSQNLENVIFKLTKLSFQAC